MDRRRAYRERQRRAALAARRRAKRRFIVAIFGVVLMVCSIVGLGRMATISANAKLISALNEELSDLETNRQYLTVNLTARKNPQRVFDEATERLGMDYPENGHVRMVSLAPYNVAGVMQAAEETQEENSVVEMTQ